MKNRLLMVLLLASAALPGLAQNPDPLLSSQATTASSRPMVHAEVRRVDAANGKVTLKHGDIPNLDMPPMTMVFQVRDPAQLNGFKAGDRVRFTAEKVNGAYTVTDLQAAP